LLRFRAGELFPTILKNGRETNPARRRHLLATAQHTEAKWVVFSRGFIRIKAGSCFLSLLEVFPSSLEDGGDWCKSFWQTRHDQ